MNEALLELKTTIEKSYSDAWFFPEEHPVKGFLGTENNFIVGDQPSTSPWEKHHPHRRAFYDVLASEHAGNFHITDLYKRRGLSNALRAKIPEDFPTHLKFFTNEIQLLQPKMILALGHDANNLLRNYLPSLQPKPWRIFHFGIIRFGGLADFQRSLRDGIKKARRQL